MTGDADPAGRPAEFAWLLVPMLLLVAGPLVAPWLPRGPASLFGPRAVAVGVAALFLCYLFAVWPARNALRPTATIAGEGTVLFLLALPFVAGPALAGGARIGELLPVGGVLLACVVVTGLVPARGGLGARLYAAGAVFFVAALPMANYALNEFGGVAGDLGFELSPLLVVRKLLLGLPGADAQPFLLLSLLLAAALLLARFLPRGSGAVVALLLLAGIARAEDPTVRPLLGDRYVPGRPLPLLVTGAEGPEVVVRVGGRVTVVFPARGETTLVTIPAPETLSRVEVRSPDGSFVTVPVAVQPVRAGERLVVSLAPIPEGSVARARERGIVLSRADPAWTEADRDELRAADAILDPGGRIAPRERAGFDRFWLPVLSSTRDEDLARVLTPRSALRRIWEEEGTVLQPDELFRLFPPESPPDPARSRTVFFVLLGLALVLLVGQRFFRKRRLALTLWSGGASLVALFVIIQAVPPLPDRTSEAVLVRDRGLRLILTRFSAERGGQILTFGPEYPIVLGRDVVYEIQRSEEDYCLGLYLGPHQSRVVVSVADDEIGARVFKPDLEFSAEGLAFPGEPSLPPAEFLSKHLRGPTGRPSRNAWLVRKLLRLADPPERVVKVRFPSPEDPFMVIE